MICKSKIRRGGPKAFTLIELLVVVTIIVVLLALLVPALDKAVYQAELAVCAAQQKGVATGSQVYAAANQRFLPDRPSLRVVANESPYIGRIQNNGDDRPLLLPYFSLDSLLCPLAGGTNIDLDIEANDPETYVYGSFSLYFGWGYPGEKAMRKLGDRFSWQGQSFSVIVADLDSDRAGRTNSAHPDELAKATHVVAQNYDPFGTQGVNTGALGKVTVSWWEGANGRGPFDRNVTFQDGSNGRFISMEWNDPEMTLVPSYNSNSKPDWQQQLPAR